MDTSEDSSPSKTYEAPPPSASGVATRCEVPAQPQVGNMLYVEHVSNQGDGILFSTIPEPQICILA